MKKENGPDAILTRANMITTARIVGTALLARELWKRRGEASWPLFVGHLALGVSDILDGDIAREDGPTRLGAFLDPIADKGLIISEQVLLAWNGRYPKIAAAINIGREAAVTLYRCRRLKKGESVPARDMGKLKNVVQFFDTGARLFPPTKDNKMLGTGLTTASTSLSVISGREIISQK